MTRTISLAAVLLLSSACSTSSDPGSFHGGSNYTNDAGPVDLDASDESTACPVTSSCGRWTTFGQSCDTCMQQKCCGCTSACANNPQCQPYIDCLLSCATNDTACANACTAKYPQGADDAMQILSCSADQCNDACYNAPAQCGAWDQVDNACLSDCVATSCCQQGAACARGSDCSKLYGCAAGCNHDQTCGQNCENQYPQQVNAYTAFVDCLNGCAAKCP